MKINKRFGVSIEPAEREKERTTLLLSLPEVHPARLKPADPQSSAVPPLRDLRPFVVSRRPFIKIRTKLVGDRRYLSVIVRLTAILFTPRPKETC